MSARLIPRTLHAEAAILLPDSSQFSIGRDPSCDLPLRDASTSRRQATLEREGDAWILRDEDSANGTFVRGRRVKRARLVGGETIRFGAVEEFRFVNPERGADNRLGSWRSFFTLALVPRDPAQPGRRFSLGAGPHVVGRDSTADFRIDSNRISGMHARIESKGAVAHVTDHRSVNGTWVNGEKVRTADIRPGDEIAFGDVLFDVKGSARLSHRGVAAAVLFTGVCGLAILGIALRPQSQGPVRLWTKDMYLEQVQTSLREALAAYDTSPPAKEVARARFDIAIRSLAAADRLPPEGWEDAEVYAALRESSAPLSRQLEGRDIVRIYQSLSERQPERRDTEIPSNPALTLPPQEKRETKPMERGSVVRDELASIVAEFGIDVREQAVPASLLAEVERFVQVWTGKERGYTERSRARAQVHLEMIRAELRRNLLPEVFCYLPFIESGYQASIGSHAGAEGLWQFMPATARKYGLTVNDGVDERTDPQLATVAACKYINDLMATFGANAFDCAVAAYNKGEYGMVSCLRGVSWKSRWKFWDAAERKDGCLKQETIEYVPRFLAAAIVMRRPEAFGFGTQAAPGS